MICVCFVCNAATRGQYLVFSLSSWGLVRSPVSGEHCVTPCMAGDAPYF